MKRLVRHALLALLVASLVVPAVSASSPPNPLCSVCDDGFERAAADNGLDLNVTESGVEVIVAENGTARWTVENELADGDAAERLQTNGTLLDRVVADAVGTGMPDADRVSDISATVSGTTVTIAFEYESFADRAPGGALVVDYVHTHGGRESYGLDADRFAVVGPDGTAVVNDPATGRVGDGRVEWINGNRENPYGTESYLQDTYVAFAANEGPVTEAGMAFAFARRTLPTVFGNLALLVPPALVFAGGVLALRRFARAEFAPRLEPLAGAVLGVGALAVAHPLYEPFVGLINSAVPAWSAVGVVYLLSGAVALGLARTDEAVPWWWLLGPALSAPALGGVLLWLPGFRVGTFWSFAGVWVAVPLAAALPLGYAIGHRDRRASRRAFGVMLAALAVLVVQNMSFTQASMTGGLMAILWAIVVALGAGFALPLVLLGTSLAENRTPSASK